MTSNDCQLCGLPTPTPPIVSDNHLFCCFGCKEVYRNFGPEVLETIATPQTAQAEVLPPEGKEAFLRIEGMHCSSCEILIERVAEKIDGIYSAKSSYATSTVKVVYDPDVIDEADLPKALKFTGYRARLSSEEAPEYDNRLDLLRVLVGASMAGLVMMLYVAFYYPTDLGIVSESEMAPLSWLAFGVVPKVIFAITTGLILYVGAPIFRGAWIGLRARILNMDDLLAIAILSAYGYSVAQLYQGSHDLYFDVAATITAIVAVGRYFEKTAKAEATEELTKLMKAWAPKARIRWGGDYKLLEIEDLDPGEYILVWEGEPIPVDGIIVDGRGAVDESLMTGEPFPVNHGPGDTVLGGSVVVEGQIEVKVGEKVESQMDNLAKILWNVQSSNAGAQGLADLVARVFVPVVLVLAAIVTEYSYLSGAPLGTALLAGLATLIVSCPCTFGLAIPLTTAAGVSAALRQGIIITSADTFVKAPHIDIVAIDKTGTLSTGDMSVVEVIGPQLVTEYAAAVERLSPHPIAKAIAKLDGKHSADDLNIHPGKGAEATVGTQRIAVGSRSLFAILGWDIPKEIAEQVTAYAPGEGVVSYVGWEGQIEGAIITRDRSRPEWESVIDQLKAHCRVVLLTGAEHPSGYEERVDEVFAGVPPEGKAAVIRQLRTQGTVVMIGDGSNDAPALAAANLGIAFGAPTALAADAADVVILGERLERIFDAFDLINTIRRRVRQNLGWALLYNATAIPLAITGLLNPLFAALAMSTSSLLVIWNSSRSLQSGNSTDSDAGINPRLIEQE
ncbi:MAG: cation-translocating P-type ATPase [Rhodospirillales bacterium]|nr:cation-translocating P-type ATPase [Rhodospirillales bacterium]